MLKRVSSLTLGVVSNVVLSVGTYHAMEVRVLLALLKASALTERLIATVAPAAVMSSAALRKLSLARLFLCRSLMTPSIGIGSLTNLSTRDHRCLQRPRPQLPLSITVTAASLPPHTSTLLMLTTASLNRPV